MEQPFDSEDVHGVLHRSTSPNGNAILLTHGAGTGRDAPLLVALAGAFSDSGFLVLRYDLPFRHAASKGPLNEAAQARDRAGILHAVQAVRRMISGKLI